MYLTLYNFFLFWQSEYTTFLENVDKKLIGNSPTKDLKVGDEGPIDVTLLEITANKTTNLRQELSGKSLVLVLLRHFA